MRICFLHLELGKEIAVVFLLCSVPDHIDFAFVERLRKFNCSSPLRYFLIAVDQSGVSLLSYEICVYETWFRFCLSDINLKKSICLKFNFIIEHFCLLMWSKI